MPTKGTTARDGYRPETGLEEVGRISNRKSSLQRLVDHYQRVYRDRSGGITSLIARNSQSGEFLAT
jgi:hypothetical protein